MYLLLVFERHTKEGNFSQLFKKRAKGFTTKKIIHSLHISIHQNITCHLIFFKFIWFFQLLLIPRIQTIKLLDNTNIRFFRFVFSYNKKKGFKYVTNYYFVLLFDFEILSRKYYIRAMLLCYLDTQDSQFFRSFAEEFSFSISYYWKNGCHKATYFRTL